MVIWIILSLVVAGADQLVKYIVLENISLTDTVEVIPKILQFVYVKNTGAAFSLLSGKTYILSIVSLAVCIFLIWYLIKKRPSSRLLLVSLGLILGGAVGNMIDRMFRNFVVDYIEVLFVQFPVFNLADVAITVGAALLMIYVIFFDNK